jgi:hypothetical protein
MQSKINKRLTIQSLGSSTSVRNPRSYRVCSGRAGGGKEDSYRSKANSAGISPKEKTGCLKRGKKNIRPEKPPKMKGRRLLILSHALPPNRRKQGDSSVAAPYFLGLVAANGRSLSPRDWRSTHSALIFSYLTCSSSNSRSLRFSMSII